MTAAELIAWVVIAIECVIKFVPPLLIALAAIGLCLLVWAYVDKKQEDD